MFIWNNSGSWKKRSIKLEGMFNKTQANDRNIGYFSLLSIQKPELVLIFFKYSSFSRMLAKSLISSASFSFWLKSSASFLRGLLVLETLIELSKRNWLLSPFYNNYVLIVKIEIF